MVQSSSPAAPTRTPEQRLKHREIQVGRLTVVLLVAAVWIVYPTSDQPIDPGVATTAFLVLGLALVSGAAWLWLASRTGLMREPALWRRIGKGLAITVALTLLRVATVVMNRS